MSMFNKIIVQSNTPYIKTDQKQHRDEYRSVTFFNPLTVCILFPHTDPVLL